MPFWQRKKDNKEIEQDDQAEESELTVKEIKLAISSLPRNKFFQLVDWISEMDNKNWDNEIEKDSNEGNLDFLITEAFSEKAKNKLKKL